MKSLHLRKLVMFFVIIVGNQWLNGFKLLQFNLMNWKFLDLKEIIVKRLRENNPTIWLKLAAYFLNILAWLLVLLFSIIFRTFNEIFAMKWNDRWQLWHSIERRRNQSTLDNRTSQEKPYDWFLNIFVSRHFA
jgi:hypothetical protein